MEHEVITLAHGAGGQLSHALMEEVVLPELGNTILNTQHDGAILPNAGRVAFTTDSYVVQPHFFPGGSIGRLAMRSTTMKTTNRIRPARVETTATRLHPCSPAAMIP